MCQQDQGNANGILMLWHLKAMLYLQTNLKGQDVVLKWWTVIEYLFGTLVVYLQTNLKWQDVVLKWWTAIEDLFRTLVIWKFKDVSAFSLTFFVYQFERRFQNDETVYKTILNILTMSQKGKNQSFKYTERYFLLFCKNRNINVFSWFS